MNQPHPINAMPKSKKDRKLSGADRRAGSGKMKPKFVFAESSDDDSEIECLGSSPAKAAFAVPEVKVKVKESPSAAAASAKMGSPSASAVAASPSKNKKRAVLQPVASPQPPAQAPQKPVLQTPQKPILQTPPRKFQPQEEEEPADSDEDEFLDENDLTPTTEALSCLCWKCGVTLKVPQSPCKQPKAEKETVLCWNAMHVHPVLNVPVCVVCVNELAGSSQDDDDNDETCHACATADDMLFCCDDCPRSFCTTCVAQAYGGGRKGHKAVLQLEQDDDKWSCPACSPPAPLKQLQESLEANTLELNDEDSTTHQRSQEEIVHELELVETELRERQRLAEDQEALQQRRDEIAQEIREGKPNLSQKKLQLLVDDEMAVWADLDNKHEQRLADMASSLHDELEGVHGLDLAKVYKQIGQNTGQAAGEEDNDSKEPEWKKAADLEITKRKLEQQDEKLPQVFSPEVYRREQYEEIEDLMTKPEDERRPAHSFRSTQERPSLEEIEYWTQKEDEKLAEHNVTIRVRCDNQKDAQEMFLEEQEISKRGAGGVSRVRRDMVLGVQQLSVRQKRKKAPPKLPPVEENKVAAAAAQPAALEDAKPAAMVPKKELATPPSAMVGGKSNNDAVDLTDDTPIVAPTNPHAAVTHENTHEVKKELFGTNFGNNNAAAAKKGLKRVMYCEIDTDEEENEKEVRLEEDEYYCPTNPVYANSDVVLSSPETFHSASGGRVKTIKVSTELTQYLKPHQKEGVRFLWKNACLDFNVKTKRDEEVHEHKEVGGAILAHSMGLGKSLTAITLIYTMMNHPGLRCKEGNKGLVHSILLVVPVNTIASWKGEFNKWTNKLQPSVLIYDLAEHNSSSRQHVIAQWLGRGGVLLVSKDSFQNMVKKHTTLQDPGPDVIVLDEAHQCLANSKNSIYKALLGVKTPRRLLLTGSPFQNNALEYYRMVSWMRPGVLDSSESAFDREFATPINAGMPSDAPPAAIAACALKSTQLKNILNPYVHRKDASVLRESLPPLQQVILHIRQSKMQTNLYKNLKRYEKRNGITSFLRRYHLSRPIHNHPACLLSQTLSDDPEAREIEQQDRTWWHKFVVKRGEGKIRSVVNGPKMVLLLHILTHAVKIGDKVVVFSQCLKTLDYIEQVLQLDNWSNHVKSLKEEFPDMELGGWTKGIEFLRIDGAIDSVKRGDLINRFNKVEATPSERVQLFLISSKAGGIGITLCAANRVVLIDSHFNPVIMNQALFRCYRFGQTKPVYAYRFLTEGTGEEKIYTRSVNKTGLSLRVIDGKNLKSCFTEKELENIELNDTWAQCDKCEKWRMLKGEAEEDLPDIWTCDMNVNDTVNNTCNASEKSARWYHDHFKLAYVNLGVVGDGSSVPSGEHQYSIFQGGNAGESTKETGGPNPADREGNEAQARKDTILSKLLFSQDYGDSTEVKKPSAMISKYYFHESLLEECEESDVPVATDSSLSHPPVPDGDRKPTAQAPTAPSVVNEPPKNDDFVTDGDKKPRAIVEASISQSKSSKEKTNEDEVKKMPAVAQMPAGCPRKPTHKQPRESEVSTGPKVASIPENKSKKRTSKALSSKEEVAATPKPVKRAEGSSKLGSSASASFSVTRVPRASPTPSKATAPNRSRSLSMDTATSKKSSTSSVAMKESPSTGSKATSLTDSEGNTMRSSPRLKRLKSNVPEVSDKPELAGGKRKSRDSSASRISRDTETEPSRKRSRSPKSKKKRKKEKKKAKKLTPVIELLEDSDDSEIGPM